MKKEFFKLRFVPFAASNGRGDFAMQCYPQFRRKEAFVYVKAMVTKMEENQNIVLEPAENETKSMIPALQEELKKPNKWLRDAVGITLFVAFVNLVFGAIINFFPSLFGSLELFEADSGIGMVLFGLLYMGMALGIYKRSRTCAIIALAVFALDAFFTILDFSGGVQASGYVMKVLIIIGLVAGVRGTFTYHATAKRYGKSGDVETLKYLNGDKKRVKVPVLVLCILLSVASAASLAVGLVHAIGLGGSYSNWVEYTSKDGHVTVRMPNAPQEQEQKMGQGITYRGASCDTLRYSTMLLSYENLLQQSIPESQLDSYKNEMLRTLVSGTNGGEVSSILNADMDGLPCKDAHVTINGTPGVFRLFAVGKSIYIAGIISKDDTITEAFLDGITTEE